jgi:hypothetical protein
MKYVVVKDGREIKEFQDIEEVNKYILQEDGHYYIISVFPIHITIEEYQVYNKKAYRIDAVNF